MRKPTERENVQKDNVLKKCFECLIETGIEGASIKDFSNATGMTASSLYYWFTDKDEIVLDATEFGMREILGELFAYATKHINNFQEMVAGFPNVVKKNSAALRVVFQIAASPKYGDQTTEISDKLLGLYDDYAMKLSKQIGVPYEKTRLIVDLAVSCVIDAVIWKEWNKLNSQLKYLFNELQEK